MDYDGLGLIDPAKVLDDLLVSAIANGPFEVVCTLLRVNGMQDPFWDPMEESWEAFEDFDWLLKKAEAERQPLAPRRMAPSIQAV